MVSRGDMLCIKPERDLKILSFSLGPDIRDGRTAVQLHFKTVEWDARETKIGPPRIPDVSTAIICVLVPGLVRCIYPPSLVYVRPFT